MSARKTRVKRERSGNLRQDRCCEAERGANRVIDFMNREDRADAMKPSQKTCPRMMHTGFFGLKNDMFLLDSGKARAEFACGLCLPKKDGSGLNETGAALF